MRVIELQTELNALGIPFALLGYVKAPAYPYGIYTDDISVSAPDVPAAHVGVAHEVIIEVFHTDPVQLKAAAAKVEGWLEAFPLSYREAMRYTPGEDHYFATFTFSYTTKRKGGTS